LNRDDQPPAKAIVDWTPVLGTNDEARSDELLVLDALLAEVGQKRATLIGRESEPELRLRCRGDFAAGEIVACGLTFCGLKLALEKAAGEFENLIEVPFALRRLTAFGGLLR